MITVNWVSKCTEYYEDGFYDNDSLKVFVARGKINEQDYKDITGIDYSLNVQ